MHSAASYTLALASAVFCAMDLTADTEVQLISYLGWDESFEIRNDTTRVVVVPAVGRIMHYSYAGEKNLIYTNPELHGYVLEVGGVFKDGEGEQAHAFFGGDRVIPTAEDRVEIVRGDRTLPDHYIDGSPYSYIVHEDGITIASPVSELLGVQLSRRIRLAAKGTRLTIEQKLTKVKPAPEEHLDNLPLTIWNLTPILPPKHTYQPLAKNSVFQSGIFVPTWSVERIIGNYKIYDGLVRLTPQTENGQKIGTDARGWIEGRSGEIVMIECFDYVEGATYPEGGTSAAAYSNPRFAELECLSPERPLKVGESLELTIHWELHRIREEAKVEAFLRSLPLQE